MINTTANNVLENILLSLQSDGTYKEYLVKYNLTASEVDLIKDGIEVSIENKFTITELDSDFSSNTQGKILFEDGCYYSVTFIANTCASGAHGHGDDSCYYVGGSGEAEAGGETFTSLIGCPGSGGDGSDGGSNPNNTPTYGGGGSGDGPLVTSPNPCSTCFPEDDDPCDQLEKIAMDIDFKEKLNDLKIKAQNSNSNYNYEASYLQIPTDSTATSYNYTYHAGTPYGDGITLDLPANTLISAFLHTHYRLNQYSVFSFEDIIAIYRLLQQGRIFDETFTAVLITKHGTTYTLKFDNPQELSDFGDNWLIDYGINSGALGADYVSTSKKIMDKFHKKIKAKNSNRKNEKNFAEFLSKYNLGLSLYKSNADFTQWEKVNTDGTTTPCN